MSSNRSKMSSDKQVLHKTSHSVTLPSKTVEKENEEKTDRMRVL